VHGIITPKNGVLQAYLNEQDKNIVKVTKKPLNDKSKPITTEYKTISHDSKNSLVEVHLITGRKHQIRAHMNFIGHPLVGEKKYTNDLVSKSNDKKFQDLTSYKIVFNFTKNAGILSYLNHRQIILKSFSKNMSITTKSIDKT
jgi:23S rRNA pseudouridine955/2504/2580 synthase